MRLQRNGDRSSLNDYDDDDDDDADGLHLMDSDADDEFECDCPVCLMQQQHISGISNVPVLDEGCLAKLEVLYCIVTWILHAVISYKCNFGTLVALIRRK